MKVMRGVEDRWITYIKTRKEVPMFGTEKGGELKKKEKRWEGSKKKGNHDERCEKVESH